MFEKTTYEIFERSNRCLRRQAFSFAVTYLPASTCFFASITASSKTILSQSWVVHVIHILFVLSWTADNQLYQNKLVAYALPYGRPLENQGKRGAYSLCRWSTTPSAAAGAALDRSPAAQFPRPFPSSLLSSSVVSVTMKID